MLGVAGEAEAESLCPGWSRPAAKRAVFPSWAAPRRTRERLRPPFSFTRSSAHWLTRFAVVDRVNALYHCDTTSALYSAGARWVAPLLDRVRRGASSTRASARLLLGLVNGGPNPTEASVSGTKQDWP